MPLINLKSDLVWHTPIPPGLVSETTAFLPGGEKISSPFVRIFNQRGNLAKIIQSNDKVSLLNAKFDQGIASRDSQGGVGHPFPDYVDKLYDWEPAAHTGFHDKNVYSDSIKITGADKSIPYGFLFKSYTTHSPIDDMYRKFNLQDESYNKSYIKQPYILRGIQRREEQQPQRWGLDVPAVVDVPQGGVITASTRAIADVQRIGKFLASPKGIIFSTMQVGLQLMNPNVENRFGRAVLPFESYGQSSKTFLPVNLLGNIAGNYLGIHIPRHGIGTDVYRYGDTIGSRTGTESVTNNRLVKLYEDLSEVKLENPPSYSQLITLIGIDNQDSVILDQVSTLFSKNRVNQPIKILSSITGPNTALGLGTTNISRRVDTFEPGRVWNNEQDHTNLSIKVGTVNLDEIFTNEPAEGEVTRGQSYATLAYGKLPENVKKFNNFGNEVNSKKLPAKYKDTLAADYVAKNIHITNGVINYSDAKPKEDYNKDFIRFEFKKHGLPSKFAIAFRAYLTALSDDHSGDYDIQQYQGNAYGKFKMNGFTRRVSISFMAAAQTQDELMTIYAKMSQLARLASPEYIKNGFVSYFTDISVGNLFRNTPCVMDNVSYSWDVTETPWEIENGKQLPKYVNIDLQLTFIGDTAPSTTYKVFDLNVTQ